MGMGGGSSVDIPQRNWSDEWPQIKQGYKGQEKQYKQFVAGEPLLTGATQTALGGLEDVGTLQAPLKSYLSQLAPILGSQIMPILSSGGALTPEQQRAADQAALGLESGAGMANANAGIAHALLNRDQFRQERFNTALNQALGLSSGIEGLTSATQGVRSGAIAPALATEEERVGSFSKLTNPILAYMSDLFSSNQNAAAAESIAGANQSAGKTGGLLSTAGSIAGAVATAY